MLKRMDLYSTIGKAALGARECRGQPLLLFSPIPRLILLLPCCRNILYFRSETGRTTEWAQAHFFVAAGWLGRQTGLGRGVS